MSDCAFELHSPRIELSLSVWADRESYLSLAFGTCTLIRPRVQPCGWNSYVRTFTVIHSSTNRTYSGHVSFTDNLVSIWDKHGVNSPPICDIKVTFLIANALPIVAEKL